MTAARRKRNINNYREIQNARKTAISGSLNNTQLRDEMV